MNVETLKSVNFRWSPTLPQALRLERRLNFNTRRFVFLACTLEKVSCMLSRHAWNVDVIAAIEKCDGERVDSSDSHYVQGVGL